MSLYSFREPVQILSGIDSLLKLVDTIMALGDRVLVFSESSLKGNSHYIQFLAQLSRKGANLIQYDGIELMRSVDALHTLLSKVRASRPHVLLALGGIRTLSLARMFAHLATSKVSVERFVAGEVPTESPLKLIDIPTSGRDPYCGSPWLLLGENFVGRPLWLHQQDNPVIMTVFDPKLHMGIPQKQAVLFLYDHLLLCADILATSQANPISHTNAAAASDMGAHALRVLAGSTKDLRTNIEACSAGTLALLALTASQPGLGVAITTVLHTRFKVPKSLASAIILPLLLEFYASYRGAEFIPLAQSLGVDTDLIDPSQIPVQAAQALRRISARMSFPGRLGDLRIGQDQIEESAALVLDLPFVKSAPTPISHSMVIELLRKAL